MTYTRVAANAIDGLLYTYTGKVFYGPSRKVVPGDKLFIEGKVKGSVVKVTDLT